MDVVQGKNKADHPQRKPLLFVYRIKRAKDFDLIIKLRFLGYGFGFLNLPRKWWIVNEAINNGTSFLIMSETYDPAVV